MDKKDRELKMMSEKSKAKYEHFKKEFQAFRRVFWIIVLGLSFVVGFNYWLIVRSQEQNKIDLKKDKLYRMQQQKLKREGRSPSIVEDLSREDKEGNLEIVSPSKKKDEIKK